MNSQQRNVLASVWRINFQILGVKGLISLVYNQHLKIVQNISRKNIETNIKDTAIFIQSLISASAPRFSKSFPWVNGKSLKMKNYTKPS